MRTFTLICAMLIVQGTLWASDYQIPYDSLRSASQKYIEATVSAKDLAKMEKNFKDAIDTKMDDTGCGRDQAMRDLMFNWAADNQGSVKRKEVKAVRQACFYFIKFVDLGYDMPWQIREQLTPESVKEILDYLEKESAKK